MSLGSPFIFSQSSLQDYADCPRRFQLRYLQEINWPAVESEPAALAELRQEEGRRFHRLVQQHLLGMPAERLAELANTPNLRRWWDNWLSAELGLDGFRLHTELALSAGLAGHRLLAQYDLVGLKDGHAVIYDWKTYQKRPRDELLAARWQTRAYRALLAVAGAHLNNGNPIAAQDIRLIYWFAEHPREPAVFSYDEPQMKRDLAAIETLFQEITSASDFPLTQEARRCLFCTYRSYCDRGEKAGVDGDFEAETSPDDEFNLDFEQLTELEF